VPVAFAVKVIWEDEIVAVTGDALTLNPFTSDWAIEAAVLPCEYDAETGYPLTVTLTVPWS
jgi:hypothetical protein